MKSEAAIQSLSGVKMKCFITFGATYALLSMRTSVGQRKATMWLIKWKSMSRFRQKDHEYQRQALLQFMLRSVSENHAEAWATRNDGCHSVLIFLRGRNHWSKTPTIVLFNPTHHRPNPVIFATAITTMITCVTGTSTMKKLGDSTKTIKKEL